MADDIVTRLREHSSPMCGACDTWGKCGFGEPCDCRCHMNFCLEAADEIERLRAALDYAVNELLPVHDHWGEFDHHEVVAHFLEEARRG